MILVQNDLMKDPVWYTLVGKEVHTQLHAATPVIAICTFDLCTSDYFKNRNS